MGISRVPPGGGRLPPLALEPLWSAVKEAAARMCGEGIGDERIRGAVEAAAARALEGCAHRDCITCDRLWNDAGLPCQKRRVRHLVKRLVMALLPFLRRGWSVEAVRAVIGDAVTRALGQGEAPRDPVAGAEYGR